MELTCWWNQLWIIFMNMKSITAARHEQHNISFLSSLPNGKKEEMLIAPPDAAPSQTAIEMKWNCGLFGAAATMGELVDELCFWFWVGYGRWHRQWLRPKEKTNNNSSISSSFTSLFSIWLNKEKIKLREKKKRGQWVWLAESGSWFDERKPMERTNQMKQAAHQRSQSEAASQSKTQNNSFLCGWGWRSQQRNGVVVLLRREFVVEFGLLFELRVMGGRRCRTAPQEKKTNEDKQTQQLPLSLYLFNSSIIIHKLLS